MVIRDKQDLRKCVKQCVRRAQVIETDVKAEAIWGEYGIAVNLGDQAFDANSLQETFEQSSMGSPFARSQGALLAALEALQLPVHNLDKAETIISGYDRHGYLTAVLRAMRARKVLVRVPAGQMETVEMQDERISPMLAVDESLFVPGRYGVDYADVALQISQQLRAFGARDMLAERCSWQALAYCLIPVCEDESVVLHIHVHTSAELDTIVQLLRDHEAVKAIVSADEALEDELIHRAMSLKNLVVRIQRLSRIPSALITLGTRFIPYASSAKTLEEMLGGWVYAKEALWQALYDAYLLLARTGYELTREGIEADIETLLCRNYEKQHE